MTIERTKTWQQLVSKGQPLTVAITACGGNWHKAAKCAYLLQGIKVIDMPYLITAAHLGLPENTDMKKIDWKTIDPKKLEAAKSMLVAQAEEIMKKADMVFLPGWTNFYIAGDNIFDYSSTKTTESGNVGNGHDPKNRQVNPQHRYRYDVEVKMLEMAKQRHLPTWGVCAAAMRANVLNGGTLLPYMDAHNNINGELHKITNDAGMPYGDMNAERLKIYTESMEGHSRTALVNNLLYPYIGSGYPLQKLEDAIRRDDPIRRFAEEKVRQGFKQYANFLALNPENAQPLNAFHRLHTVMVKPDSALGLIYTHTHPDMDLSKPIAVHSSHYEGISKVPVNLQVTAKSTAGFPGAIEVPDLPFGLFTLYHPETNVDGQISEDGKYQYRGIAMEIVRAQALYAKFLKDRDAGINNQTDAPSFKEWAKTNELDLNRRERNQARL